MTLKRFLTEYDNICDGGALYAGPMLLADALPAALALVTCVQGPNGEALRVVGELIDQIVSDDGDTTATVRHRSAPSIVWES